MILLKTIAILIFAVYQLLRVPAVQVPALAGPMDAKEVKRPTLTIVVAKDGSLSHKNKKITLAQLTELCQAHKKKHPNGALNIRADKQAHMKQVRVVLDAAAKADLVIVLFDSK